MGLHWASIVFHHPHLLSTLPLTFYHKQKFVGSLLQSVLRKEVCCSSIFSLLLQDTSTSREFVSWNASPSKRKRVKHKPFKIHLCSPYLPLSHSLVFVLYKLGIIFKSVVTCNLHFYVNFLSSYLYPTNTNLCNSTLLFLLPSYQGGECWLEGSTRGWDSW